MSIGTDLIKDAYTEVGANSQLKAVSEFDVEFARRKLQRMMQEWIDDDMDFGFTATEFASDEVSIPVSVEEAVVTNLALRLVSSKGRPASQDLKAAASVSLSNLRDRYQSKESADRIVSGTMPLGAGNTRGIKPRVFANSDFTISDVETNAGDPLI